jgi:HEPN domain-containing protein
MNPLTKELVKEWLNKADADYETALLLYKKKKKNIYYIIAFHCQQAIEKYLKALLICDKIDFPKTHDLIRLLDLIKTKDSFLNGIRKELNLLNPFAVGFRYPGENIESGDLIKIVKITKKLAALLVGRIKEFI